MLKCLVSVLLLSGSVTSKTADILEYTNEVLPDKYKFRFVTSDGTQRVESGQFREDGVWEVQGSFVWIDPDGNKQYKNFIADDKGYRVIEQPTKLGNRLTPGTLASLTG